MVSYLQYGLADRGRTQSEGIVRYPSLGSLIDFRLMYSSYSKSPARLLSFCYGHLVKKTRTIKFGMLPVECQFRQEEVDIIS